MTLSFTMPYLTKDEVLDMLREHRHKEVIEQHLISGLPFVFRDVPDAYQDFTGTLAAQFSTPIEDISVIGSARIGFSLSPEKFGTPFQAKSDLDTIVVNAEMFDSAWFQLYNVGSRRSSMDQRVQLAFKEHQRNNVFFGFIVPELLPGIVTLSNLWFDVFQHIGGRIRVLAGHKINGRLYRTWDHVKAHQNYSLEGIATKFAGE
jgi:hypothetical protein